jgi:DNA primase
MRFGFTAVPFASLRCSPPAAPPYPPFAGGGAASPNAEALANVRVDDGIKREILARADIGEVIGAYVTLRKRGNDLVGLCPFHGEKSPSFHVHPDRGFFKCFGCGVGGDVLPSCRSRRTSASPTRCACSPNATASSSRTRIRARRASAARRRRSITPTTSRARGSTACCSTRAKAPRPAYCANRGISEATIEAFALGYAPAELGWLVDDLRRNDVAPEIAVTAGLIKPNQRGGYDFYRERLMIPTFATTGETIAFGGRALGDQEPKYLNTATTPVYTKGRFLFALNVARRAAAREETVIVVEGYLDCIALHQAGFPNAVAALGTAFTAEQAREIARVASRALLCFDADAAGVDATLKSIDALSTEGVAAFAVRIPEGKDPDEFIRRNGAAAFGNLLERALPATQVRIDAEIERRGPHGNGAALARWAEETIRRLAPPEEQDRWRVYAAQRLGLAVDDLRRARLMVNPVHFVPRGSDANASRHVVPAVTERPSFEREVLAIALDDPALVAEYAERIPAERFATPQFRHVWEALRAHARSLVQPSDVFAVFQGDEDAAATLASVSGSVRLADAEDRRAKLDRVVARFARDDAERRYRELDAELTQLVDADRPVPDDLRAEHVALAVQLKKG